MHAPRSLVRVSPPRRRRGLPDVSPHVTSDTARSRGQYHATPIDATSDIDVTSDTARSRHARPNTMRRPSTTRSAPAGRPPAAARGRRRRRRRRVRRRATTSRCPRRCSSASSAPATLSSCPRSGATPSSTSRTPSGSRSSSTTPGCSAERRERPYPPPATDSPIEHRSRPDRPTPRLLGPMMDLGVRRRRRQPRALHASAPEPNLLRWPTAVLNAGAQCTHPARQRSEHRGGLRPFVLFWPVEMGCSAFGFWDRTEEEGELCARCSRESLQ